MYELILEHRSFPSRISRYCCRTLKEHGGNNRLKITGIRSAESNSRKLRSKFEYDKKNPETKMIHLIIDWSDKEVWDYIRTYIGHWNPVYDKGFKRVGCIGCPMSYYKQRIIQFEMYPNHKKAYLNAIKKVLAEKPNKHFGTDAELFFEWWIGKLSVENFLRSKGLK